MYNEKELRFFDALGIRRPDHISHSVNQDTISSALKQLRPHTWRLEGNQLRGMTDMGELVQTIPTDYILTGTDDNGLPIFKKVDIT